MTRRDMISSIGMVAAGSLVSETASGAASEATPASFQIGVASYSFRDFQRGLAIKMIKQLGVTEISVKQDYHMPYTLTPAEIARAAGEFKRAGLTITSCGNTDMKSLDPADLKKYFEHAKAAGVPMLVTAPLHENLGAIEKLAKEYDIQIAIHTHGPEDKNFPSPKVVLDAVKGMDPRMGLCMDVAHSMRAGADVVQEIENAGPRLLDMHFKDLKDNKPTATYCDVGEGVMPVVAIFKQLKKFGYRGCVNLEWEINSDNPMPGMLHSLGYMHGVLAALA
jgi:sugar phosphate isomerase/epimerase